MPLALCVQESFQQEHLAPWQTPQAVVLAAFQLPQGLSCGQATDEQLELP